jgi:endonuclease YncB( thermonuclease family)
VYKARVERIVDGDTLLVKIDLGFQVRKEQRIRFAEVDASPLETKEGRKAFRFVRDRLAGAPFIMVQTNQIDLHGRYVAHVFYDFYEKNRNKVFLEGNYFNQELLARGLAVRG